MLAFKVNYPNFFCKIYMYVCMYVYGDDIYSSDYISEAKKVSRIDRVSS